MKLFKGYIPTKNKACLKKFTGVNAKNIQTYRQVKGLEEFAGILDEETILIDIDDFRQSEILFNIVDALQLRCRVYETTRGKHFLFKNNGQERCRTHCNLAIGIESDIKLGCRNSYSILKFGGKERKVIYDIFQDEEYQEVPKWLLPIDAKTDFLSLKAGEGRNQSLFNYILTLQANDFSVDEARETIRIINQFVLEDKLEDEEIETILRDDSFKKPVFFKKTTFLFDKFATYLKNNLNIIRIDGRLHMYEDGIYIAGEKRLEAEMIKLIPNLSANKRREVMAYLELLVTTNTKPTSANYIAFRNGVYNIVDDTLEEFSAGHIITNRIDYDYNPNAKSEVVDRTLDKLACGDKEIRALLEEAIGYCFFRRNELRKCFILTGDKRNGKSTYLSVIETLLGENNIASLDLKELDKQFKTAELFGKLANIGDDIGDEFIPNPAIFKKLVSGNSITVERKGKDPFKFANYAKLLFSANDIPRIKDKSGAVKDRLIIIPFEATFSKSDPDYDPYIKDKLTTQDAIEYFIKLGVAGLKRVLENKAFTTSQKVEKTIVDYEQSNNPILLFFEELDKERIINEPTNHVYQRYTEFCHAGQFTPLSNIEFSKQTKKHFNLEIVSKKIKGKVYRVFVEK